MGKREWVLWRKWYQDVTWYWHSSFATEKSALAAQERIKQLYGPLYSFKVVGPNA